MGGRGSSSGMGGRSGGVTPTSIPSATVDNIQKFVEQFGTGMSVQEMAEKVYRALPNTGGVAVVLGNAASKKDASILNDKYIRLSNGTVVQFIRQKSKGTWKVETW